MQCGLPRSNEASSRGAPFDEISPKFRVFDEISSFRFSCLGLFSKCRSCTWHMPGFGKAARRPNGDVGCSPAGPSDRHGGWPGIGQWGRGRRCHPGGGMRPPKRHACNVHRCRKHRCTGSGMGRHPIQAHPTHDAHTVHTIRTEVYFKPFRIKASRGGMRPTGSKAAGRQVSAKNLRLETQHWAESHLPAPATVTLPASRSIIPASRHTCVRASARTERAHAACCVFYARDHKACTISSFS